MSEDSVKTTYGPLMGQIRQGSERYGEWIRVFGTDVVRLKSALPQYGSAPGVKDGLFYQLDLDALTPAQRAALVANLSAKFEIPPQEIEQDLAEHGVPILADDVLVSVTAVTVSCSELRGK